MNISDLLEKDELAERDQKAECYMYRCLGYKVLHPWKWWFRRLMGGVGQ